MMVLTIGHVIIGTTSMLVGYIYGRLSGIGHAYTLLLTVFGFAAGNLISVVALSTISSVCLLRRQPSYSTGILMYTCILGFSLLLMIILF